MNMSNRRRAASKFKLTREPATPTEVIEAVRTARQAFAKNVKIPATALADKVLELQLLSIRRSTLIDKINALDDEYRDEFNLPPRYGSYE